MSLQPRAERRLLVGALAVTALALLLVFPPFHLRRTGAPGATAAANVAQPLDVQQLAARFWQQQLRAAQARAVDTDQLLAALREDAEAAGRRLGRQAGLGGSRYFLVKGSGRVLRVDVRRIWLATAAHSKGEAYLVSGPVFGNALRDVTGAADINDFSSFDFNALSAALNARSEADNAQALRQARAGSPLSWLAAAELETSPAGPVLKMIAFEVGAP